jgi:hypothetical protein
VLLQGVGLPRDAAEVPSLFVTLGDGTTVILATLEDQGFEPPAQLVIDGGLVLPLELAPFGEDSIDGIVDRTCPLVTASGRVILALPVTN